MGGWDLVIEYVHGCMHDSVQQPLQTSSQVSKGHALPPAPPLSSPCPSHTSTAPGADGEIKLMGDVDFAGVSQVAGAISPVPGGVGPLTVAGLLMNTVDAYQQHMTAESQRVSSNM